MTPAREALAAQRTRLLDTQATWLAILTHAAVEFDFALRRDDSIAALAPRLDALHVAAHRFAALAPEVNRVERLLAEAST